MESKQKTKKENKMKLRKPVNALEITKMKQGMSYSCKEKIIILNVFKYFRTELPDRCVTEIVRRTANATGCSEKSVFQFRKEEASEEGFKEPSKTKIRKNININSRDIKYDNTVRQTIRSIIYDLQYKNIPPSLSTILKNVNANSQIPNFSLMTLRRLMFDMGFSYEKNGNKSILVDKPDTRYGKVYLTTQNDASMVNKTENADDQQMQQQQQTLSQQQNVSHESQQQPPHHQLQMRMHQNAVQQDVAASVPVPKADAALLPVQHQHHHHQQQQQQQTPVPDHRILSTMQLAHHHHHLPNNIRPQTVHEQTLMGPAAMHTPHMMLHPSRRNSMLAQPMVSTHHANTTIDMHVKREHLATWMHPLMNKT